uniref:CCRfamide n=1 Tax=Nephrops norvegicus TaxID=6829 RepID=A0A4P1LWZ2_NEPNO|nr:CCRfamide [Nephrops norvegicus]
MVSRVGVVVVVMGAWLAGGGQVLANYSQCDVQALRCDVICAFPDLGLHCSRCIRRRPMRFGKRSEEPARTLSEAATGSPLVAIISHPGPTHLQKTKSQDPGQSGLASTTVQYKRTSRVHDAARPVVSSSLRQLINKVLWNEYTARKTLTSGDREQEAHSSQLGRYVSDLQSERGPDYDDSTEGVEYVSFRRSRRSPHHTLDNLGSGGVQSDGRFPVERRSKRSGVHEVIEGLMDLLGLDELPVDPTLYGCHELLLD